MKRDILIKKLIDPTLPLIDGQEEHFCELYAGDKELMGNGIQCAIEAFDIDITEKGAYVMASNKAQYLLRKPTICARINNFIERMGFNDQFVDKQHAFIIAQHADLRSKMAAIKEYNALKGRVKQKLELSFKDKTDKDLDDERAKLERELREAEAEQRNVDNGPIDASKGINPDVMANLSDEERATVTGNGPAQPRQATASVI